MTPFFRVTQTVFGHRLSEFSGLSPREATRASLRPSASTSPASSEAFRASHRRAALTLGAMRNEFPAKTTQEANKLHASMAISFYQTAGPRWTITILACLRSPLFTFAFLLRGFYRPFKRDQKRGVEGSLFLVHPGLTVGK